MVRSSARRVLLEASGNICKRERERLTKCTFSTNEQAIVLWRQPRFGHKSALKAYVSTEQLQNILRKCVCGVTLFWGLGTFIWLVFAAFPPPLGPCPKTVELTTPVWQPPFGKIHTALLPVVKSNPSKRNGPVPSGNSDRTLRSTDAVQR